MKSLLLRSAGVWGPVLAEQLARTWRMELAGAEAGQILARSGKPYVLTCWHEFLLPVMWQHRGIGIAAVISEARDGEYLARFAGRLGYRLVRGSSTRGGDRALRGAIRALREGWPIGVTPDGPRGPRRQVKPGVLAAAAATGIAVLPVRVEAGSAWRAGSWDRFMVPKPWARVRLEYGEPFGVGRGTRGLAEASTRLTQALDDGAREPAWQDGEATPTG